MQSCWLIKISLWFEDTWACALTGPVHCLVCVPSKKPEQLHVPRLHARLTWLQHYQNDPRPHFTEMTADRGKLLPWTCLSACKWTAEQLKAWMAREAHPLLHQKAKASAGCSWGREHLTTRGPHLYTDDHTASFYSPEARCRLRSSSPI